MIVGDAKRFVVQKGLCKVVVDKNSGANKHLLTPF
jgi:hypothetical protein